MLAAAVFGAGFGLYLGVDVALAVRMLPSQYGRGKNLGLMYNSIYLSLIVSPLIGGLVLSLSPNGFAVLFAMAALPAILASVLLLPIRTGL